MQKYIYIIGVAMLALFSSCKDNEKEALEQLMTEIRNDYAEERDSACLIAIDTLRARYPQAVAERKEALVLYQKASLRIAQRDLEQTDKDLEAAKIKFAEMEQTVNAHKAEGIATADELTALTMQRMHRDSLQVHFDVLCAQIKYIHKRQKQN